MADSIGKSAWTVTMNRIADKFYIAGLFMLIAGLPVSLFLTSLSQFFLVASVVFRTGIGQRLRRFFSNTPLLLLSGIWFMHLLGMLWTSHVDDGLKDLRIKLPLLLLPLVIGSNEPLTAKKLRWVLLAFVGSVFCGTMVSMAVLAGIIHRNIYDIRDVFIFNISHIRFALFTCLCVFILVQYTFYDKSITVSRTWKVAGLLMIIWLLIFLMIVVSVTGLMIIGITSLLLLFVQIVRTSKKSTKAILLVLLIIIPVVTVVSLKALIGSYTKNKQYVFSPEEKTKLGNNYDPAHTDTVYENGYPVWVLVNEGELKESWNRLSNIKYDSLDERKQPIRATLVRFMASKGLRKDAEGINKLTPEERRSIERGVANVNYQNVSSLRSRIQQIVWEVDQFFKVGYENGHSVTQRFEFWHAGIRIAKDNLFTGVGTGDLPHAFEEEYDRMHSPLDAEHRLRSHNQFLAIMVSFGIFGLLYFLVAMFYPFINPLFKPGMLFTAFFLIIFFSMFSEDTLETQAGATFFAFFFALLIPTRWAKFSVTSTSNKWTKN